MERDSSSFTQRVFNSCVRQVFVEGGPLQQHEREYLAVLHFFTTPSNKELECRNNFQYETDMRLIQRCKFLEDQDEKKAIQHLLKERGYTKAEILKLTIDG